MIFKIGRTRKFGRGRRLPFGYVYLNKIKGICYDHICVEQHAIQDMSFRIRIKTPILAYNTRSGEMCTFGARHVFRVHHMQFVPNAFPICLCSDGTILFYDNAHVEKLPVRQILMVQIRDQDAVIRTSADDASSQPLGLIEAYSVVLIEDLEFQTSGYWSDTIRLKLYQNPGYIKLSCVQLLGYADEYTKRYLAPRFHWISGTDHPSASEFLNNLRRVCIVCHERDCDCVLLHNEGAHLITCMICAAKIRQINNQCPVCREPITNIVKIYT